MLGFTCVPAAKERQAHENAIEKVRGLREAQEEEFESACGAGGLHLAPTRRRTQLSEEPGRKSYI